jgi:WD40 repeat protein
MRCQLRFRQIARSGPHDKTVRVWDAVSGEAKLGCKALEGHVTQVKSVSFSRDGRTTVSCPDDHLIRLWNARTGESKHGVDVRTELITLDNLRVVPVSGKERWVPFSLDLSGEQPKCSSVAGKVLVCL